MTPMYLMLVMCIAGYLTAMFIDVLVVLVVLVVPILGAIDGEFFLPLRGLMWAWIVAIGLAVNGLSYFFGRFITMPALTIFVFISIPASGLEADFSSLPRPKHRE